MSGTLHIFRREVVNGSPLYQINYNLASRSFAIVLQSQHELDDFLTIVAALPDDLADATLSELNRNGSVNVSDVLIAENAAVAHGMKITPTDF
jgi:hypothetical protein